MRDKWTPEPKITLETASREQLQEAVRFLLAREETHMIENARLQAQVDKLTAIAPELLESYTALKVAVKTYQESELAAVKKEAEYDGLILPIVDETLEIETEVTQAWDECRNQYHNMANRAMYYVQAVESLIKGQS